jgi:hypothetical protein
MLLPYFSEDFLATVRSAANTDHRSHYAQNDPWVRSLAGATTGIRDSQVEVVELPDLICEPDARTEADAANAIALYERLKILTPVQASDERLWSCLAHTAYWNYTRVRWQGGSAQSFDSVETRWFFKGNSMERLARNAIARLWWGAYATVLPDAAEPYRLTHVLFSNTDIQFHYMERLFGKNRCVLHSALNYVEKNLSRIRLRKAVGPWAAETGKLLNSVGGVLQLDALSSTEIEEVLEVFLQQLYRRTAGQR